MLSGSRLGLVRMRQSRTSGWLLPWDCPPSLGGGSSHLWVLRLRGVVGSQVLFGLRALDEPSGWSCFRGGVAEVRG